MSRMCFRSTSAGVTGTEFGLGAPGAVSEIVPAPDVKAGVVILAAGVLQVPH